MKCWNGSRFHSIPITRQDQISAKCSCLKKGVSIKEESVEDGREMRERRSGRRGVQRIRWEFVSHLSDRPLASILATLSDRHCQVIISKALHLTHRQMEAVYVCVNEIKRKCDIVSSSFRACVSVSAFSGNLFIGQTRSVECVYLALTHTSFVHACLQNPCQSANLNEPPCRLLCVNANMYISTFTAVSLFNSLSKGQTS